MIEIRNRILQIRRDRGISWEDWANLAHKTADTIKKQTSEAANPTLETMLEMLRPLRATLVAMTDEEKADFDNLPSTKQRLADIESQIAVYENNRLVKEQEILKLSSIIEKQAASIEILQNRIMAKDERMERKDDLIRQLLIEKQVIKA